MIEFRLPSLGADMDEAMLVGWLVAPGDEVERGQVIAEVETDKGIIEVECWEAGLVAELLVTPSSERLPVGTPLAVLRPIGEGVTVPVPAGPVRAQESPPPRAPEPVVSTSHGESIVPPIRHLAHELGVDLAQVTATGSGGTITRDDVRRAAAASPAPGNGRRPRATPRARHLAGERGLDLTMATATRADGLIVAADLDALSRAAPPQPQPEADDRASAMRRAIGRSMARSKREIPHYYVGTAIDLHILMSWLDEENDRRSIDRRLLPAAALLKATALALSRYPELNGHMLDDGYRPSPTVHLGVAVSLREGGLTAPAIHDAQSLTVDELMAALRDVVNRARTWRLRSSEMSDPTATVTNLGDRGVEMVYPVIIPPQVAIVGFGKIADRPWVEDGNVVVHPVVNATLAADHRVSDGHRGGLFLATLDQLLQEPERL